MNAYLFMTLVGVTAKLAAGYALRPYWRNSAATKIVALMVICLLIQSGFELLLYYFSNRPDSVVAYWSMIGYYIFAFSIITLFPFVAASAIEMRINRYLASAATVAFITLATILCTTHLIIEGIATLDYTLTRVPGPFYWIFQVSAMLSVLFTVVTLFRGRKTDRLRMKTKATNLLLAFIPIPGFTIFIVFAMEIGLPLNAVGILPLCMVVYIAALIHNLRSDRIPDYFSYVPWSKRRRMIRKLSKPFRVVDLTPSDSKKLAKEYEQALVEHAIDIFEDRKQAAEWLNISQAKISKLIGKRRTDNTLEES